LFASVSPAEIVLAASSLARGPERHGAAFEGLLVPARPVGERFSRSLHQVAADQQRAALRALDATPTAVQRFYGPNLRSEPQQGPSGGRGR